MGMEGHRKESKRNRERKDAKEKELCSCLASMTYWLFWFLPVGSGQVSGRSWGGKGCRGVTKTTYTDGIWGHVWPLRLCYWTTGPDLSFLRKFAQSQHKNWWYWCGSWFDVSGLCLQETKCIHSNQSIAICEQEWWLLTILGYPRCSSCLREFSCQSLGWFGWKGFPNPPCTEAKTAERVSELEDHLKKAEQREATAISKLK